MAKETQEQKQTTITANVKSCETCRWTGCNYYGHKRDVCVHYIDERK